MAHGGGWSDETPHGTLKVLGVLLCALLPMLGCSVAESDGAALLGPGDYLLGGQTGSLIPGCGVAPLSAAGRGVPAGDALAVLYTGECADRAALARVARDAAGAAPVPVELVPLDADGAFLVRSAAGLSAGEYQLTDADGETAELRVEEAAPALPMSVGALRLEPSATACPDSLRFELELEPAALAYAPLSRFMLRVDDGEEQLWIDYGALAIEPGGGSRGALELPRCGLQSCLSYGRHSLELRMQIAGEELAPAPLSLDFDVECLTPLAASSTSTSVEPSCAIGGAVRRRAHACGWMGATCMIWLALRRRLRAS